MGTIWLTADTHFGHQKVATIRGYPDTETHDRMIVRHWKRMIRDDDHVWHLGDLALGGWRDALEIVANLPGIKHLVLGNHDRAHPTNRQAHQYQHEYLHAFASIQTAAQLSYQGTRVLLSHFPYTGEGERPGPDRDTQWRLADEGTLLLHGHTHTTSPLTTSRHNTPQVNVGLDAWQGRPVTIADAIRAAHQPHGC